MRGRKKMLIYLIFLWTGFLIGVSFMAILSVNDR